MMVENNTLNVIVRYSKLMSPAHCHLFIIISITVHVFIQVRIVLNIYGTTMLPEFLQAEVPKIVASEYILGCESVSWREIDECVFWRL